MGYGSYSFSARSTRALAAGYHTKSSDQIFTQAAERKAHESMLSKGLKVRECRDSAEHPDTVPIILGLDVTGSMGHIPNDLIKDGLPTLMGKLIQQVPDASLCFVAFGDHECDRYPLQVGQFESGDAELDMWLTRTYLEKNGGGNGGESYLLPWHFAANFVKADAIDVRKKKGFLITVGDEPTLKDLPQSAIREIYGDSAPAQSSTNIKQILKDAQEKFEVFHIALAPRGESFWREILGQNYIPLSDYKKVPETIVKIVLDNLDTDGVKPDCKYPSPHRVDCPQPVGVKEEVETI